MNAELRSLILLERGIGRALYGTSAAIFEVLHDKDLR
jgi:hypothetical protein